MDHDLPLTLALIATGFRISHEGQAPLLKLVDGRVNVPCHVVRKVFANHSHEVITGVAHMILRLVLIPLHAHVAVDRVKPLRDSTASINVCLLSNHDPHIATPMARFIGGACAAHAAADNKNVAIFKNSLETH